MGTLRIETKDGVTEMEFPPKKTQSDESKTSQKRKTNKQTPKTTKPED